MTGTNKAIPSLQILDELFVFMSMRCGLIPLTESSQIRVGCSKRKRCCAYLFPISPTHQVSRGFF